MAKDFSTIQTKLPLGLRNNNPGNLRPFSKTKTYLGHVGTNKGFIVFKDITYGIRAMAKNAVTQITKNGKNTIVKYITAYAPPAENDTAKYIKLVSNALGLKANSIIPTDTATLKKLIRIHLDTEIGNFSQYITDTDIIQGLQKLNES